MISRPRESGGTILTWYPDGTEEVMVAGTWIQPIRRGYIMVCCDCGLRHRMDFRVKAGQAQFRAWRMKGRSQNAGGSRLCPRR